MAIGDTVQAGLMRVDTTPLLQAQIRSSEQMGNAIAGLGRDIGSGIEKFMQNKKEGEAADMQIGALLQNMSPERQKEIQSGEGELGKSLSKFLSGELGNSKKKALLGSLMTINTADQLNREEAMDAERFKQQQEINNLNRLIAQGKIDDRLSDRQATDRFITKLYSQAPTGKLNEAGQDDLERGLAFLAPGPQAREKYKNRLLQDPQFQQTEPVMGMTGNPFLQQFAGEIPAVQERALAFMQSRQKDAPTISRVVNMEDGQGGFQQIGVDNAGNPIRSFGPPKPSGMFASPDEQAATRAKTLSVDNANEFVNTQRNEALDSAKSIRPATRALTLLEKGELDTGGIAELKTNAIAMLDSLGIPIDEQTMEKVANTQNFRAEVGKFLFDNISNTKGSISEKEMDIFAKISPGLQMTPEANKTLLNYVIKKAERDKDKVKFIQKMRRDGVSIIEQRNRLEDYMLDNDLSEILSPIAGQTSEQQNFRTPQGEVKGEVVGVKPDGSKLIKVNGKIFVQPAQ